MVVVPRPPSGLAPGLAARLAADHPVQWRTAAPLWPAAAPDKAALVRPAILRFATDSFMEDFLAIATQAPQRLGEWQVQPETWRQPAPVPPLPPRLPTSLPSPDLEPEAPAGDLADQPLKLYQPAHQRYYLVTANLVCRIPGFPDRPLKTNHAEQVSFVLRRQLADAADGQIKEHALVGDRWQPVGEVGGQLLPGEAQFPMFPTHYRQADGYGRRLFAGLIPVGERERFLNAPRQAADGESARLEDRLDQLVALLTVDVLAPWRELLRQVGDNPMGGSFGPATRTLHTSLQEIRADGDVAKSVERAKVVQAAIALRDQLQLSSWYALLDFAHFLQTYLPQVWAVIGGSAAPGSLSTAQRHLYTALQGIQFRPGDTSFDLAVDANYYRLLVGQAAPDGTPVSLTQALLDADAAREFLETTTRPYEAAQIHSDDAWPESVFLLCGRGLRSQLDSLDDTHDLATRTLTTPGLVRLALAEEAATATRPLPQTPLAQAVSLSAQAADTAHQSFQIRCVFQRPHCPPSLHPTVVSQPTEPFQMASYFDPDAPSRAIRIPMPVDTSPAGLRKFAKNTSFVISDSLSCQIEKARSLTFGDLVLSVLPWPFNKKLDTSGAACSTSGIDIGKICTLSIPIITICALILLIIFVLLLDIIFKWVPYLIFCLPLPGLKSKEDS